MRTAAEVENESKLVSVAIANADRNGRESFLAALPALDTVPEHRRPMADRVRHEIEFGGRSASGIACNSCGTELWTDGHMLLSNPPQQWHDCPACGARYCLPYGCRP